MVEEAMEEIAEEGTAEVIADDWGGAEDEAMGDDETGAEEGTLEIAAADD
jgi:hypothetical protein